MTQTATAHRLELLAELELLLAEAGGAAVDATETTVSFTDTQEHLIAARDRGRVFPGCTAPPSWCDTHHLHHPVDGTGVPG